MKNRIRSFMGFVALLGVIALCIYAMFIKDLDPLAKAWAVALLVLSLIYLTKTSGERFYTLVTGRTPEDEAKRDEVLSFVFSVTDNEFILNYKDPDGDNKTTLEIHNAVKIAIDKSIEKLNSVKTDIDNENQDA